ncbi:killer cell lectin-like receptor subfamily B member 1B allele A isoform X1 [Acipenser oxyrinchus oxyrinchus]|uniref:Killer cell lectin-like receptor subfamily B member 1B allele A isoform X1 n=1 Tax=Acipenser oxyrinchus oxyrinchus TaxID=40147 RepID=A0AAD8D6S9_ACIOX|nr:killer cell lectin-like receptor subfamily B member 1B allele A isoform X1 [Acipenser oxyrinchus oxyrinchus]
MNWNSAATSTPPAHRADHRDQDCVLFPHKGHKQTIVHHLDPGFVRAVGTVLCMREKGDGGRGEEVTGVPDSAAASTPPAHRAVSPVQSSSCSRVITALGAAVCVLLLAITCMGAAIMLCLNHSEPDVKKSLQQCTNDLSMYKNYVRKTFSEPCELCPEGWKKGYNGSCYFISTQYASWDFANESCSKLGAHLAVIEGREELKTMDSATRGFCYWIGLSRREGDWKWRWVDNTQLDEKKISVRNAENKLQKCAFVQYESVYSKECHSTLKWICEQDAVRF